MKKVLVHICGVCLWYCERLAFYTLGCRLFNHAQCMPLILLSFKIACLFHYIKKDYAYKVVKSLSMHEWATLTFSKKSARWEPFAKFGERERSTLRPKRLVSTFVHTWIITCPLTHTGPEWIFLVQKLYLPIKCYVTISILVIDII